MRLKCEGFSYTNELVLGRLNLSIKAGERVALMGGSGSGKTTLLKICAGLQKYRNQNMSIIGFEGFSFIFQQNLLLEHLTVLKNIILPGAVFQGDQTRLQSIIDTLGLNALLNKYPYELSGGQQKRVAIARAFVYPQIKGLFMDEPFTGLDEPLRDTIIGELKDILNNKELPCLFTTHSPFEAAFLANRVLFLGGDPSSIIEEYNVGQSNKSSELQNEVNIIRHCLRKYYADNS